MDTMLASCAVPLRILIVDDFAPFRKALRQDLELFPTLTVVGEAEDGRAAVERAVSLQPHLILMDASMPHLSGAEATRRIKRIYPRTHVIALSLEDNDLTQESMRIAGCTAFVSKECVHTLPGIIEQITGVQVIGTQTL
jgi:two-component system response regulator NreC